MMFYNLYETTVKVSDFEHSVQGKNLCEGCREYKRNFTCPPYSPRFHEYIRGAKQAKVICVEISAGRVIRKSGRVSYGVCFGIARSILVRELFRYRYRVKKSIIAGAGACTICTRCAASKGEKRCGDLRKMLYSLESLGVSVSALVRKCFDIDLKWHADERFPDSICAVGAVFF